MGETNTIKVHDLTIRKLTELTGHKVLVTLNKESVVLNEALVITGIVEQISITNHSGSMYLDIEEKTCVVEGVEQRKSYHFYLPDVETLDVIEGVVIS